MRLAILCGANPRRCITGPVVRLGKGHWALHVEHMVDSDLSLLVQGRPATQLKHQMKIQLSEPTDVTVDFAKRGSESFINVFVEKVA